MTVEISFPLEFWLEGAPVSLQASVRSKEGWKRRVEEAVRSMLPEGHWATEGPVGVTIYYFPDTRMVGDLDNILKPILDALGQIVYVDDQQVERILVQKFEPGKAFSLAGPSPTLLEAAGNGTESLRQDRQRCSVRRGVMVQGAEVRETAVLDILREKYEGDGFSFFAHPSGSIIPSFLQGYRPDAIAVRGNERIAIEVNQRRSSVQPSRLSEIADRFTTHPDWKFLVVYPGELGLDSEHFVSSSQADIERQLSELEELSTSKYSRAAFVLAWATLEALTRARLGSPVGTTARSPREIVEILERNGLVDFEEGKMLRDFVRLRNAAVHGDFATNISRSDLEGILRIARRLADEVRSAA